MNNAILCFLIFFLVELLAYKVEQEKCIASDLQKTLNEEQQKANNARKLLVVEQNTVKALKSELSECKQDNERLLKSLNDVQREVLQLRYVWHCLRNTLPPGCHQTFGRINGSYIVLTTSFLAMK